MTEKGELNQNTDKNSYWVKNIFPKKLFQRVTFIVIIICQIIIIIMLFIVYFINLPFSRNYIYSIIYLYIIISIFLLYPPLYNYNKQKSLADFFYILTKKGIAIKLNDSTEKVLYWKGIYKIEERSDVKGIAIHEDYSTYPILIFGNEKSLNVIKDYYKKYH